MLVVLPPSETKALGGIGPALDFSSLSFPTLTGVHREIAADLVALSADAESAMATLKLGPRLADEVAANAALLDSPTMPALERYTGVLYDALNPAEIPAAGRERLAISSALFGVVGGGDMIPHYRLSGTVKLPVAATGETPTLRKRWGTAITEALSDVDFLLDLRSGTYANLGKVKGATTATVLTAEGKIVSHFNKHYKGLLARAVAMADRAPESAHEVVEVARDAGHDVSLGDGQIIFRVPAA
nr:peroxide stress protein YaaA [Corynebacterium lactis]